MINVYFEKQNKYAELMAKFENEWLYNACLPILKIRAAKINMIVTESVEEETDEDYLVFIGNEFINNGRKEFIYKIARELYKDMDGDNRPSKQVTVFKQKQDDMWKDASQT